MNGSSPTWPSRERSTIPRRHVLALLASGCLAGLNLARAEHPPSAGPIDEDKDLASVLQRAKEVNLGEFHTQRSRHFQASGDVGEAFLRLVLHDCEDVAQDFEEHFTEKRFSFKLPDRRMTVVALSDDIAYARFFGSKTASLANPGKYDLKNNRLVVLDFRSARERIAERVSYLNLMTVAHEVTHQLCYNSGVLDRAGDAPRCVSEGLATYAEERPPHSRSAMGRLNNKRLDDLAFLQRQVRWMPIRSLIATDDALFGKLGGVRLLLAYSQSWLFVYYLMNHDDRLAQFHDYLRTIYPRRDPKHRIEDAEKHFGDLTILDAELKRFSIRLLKSR